MSLKTRLVALERRQRQHPAVLVFACPAHGQACLSLGAAPEQAGFVLELVGVCGREM